MNRWPVLVSGFLFAQVASAGYVAHEWGTFTSLEDSEGKTAEGMYHGDAELPAFVHGRGQALSLTRTVAGTQLPPSHCYHSKDCDFDPEAGTPLTVTQKMETPVIYFYSDQPLSLGVDVDFPGGIITQYFPDVSEFSPPIGKVDAVASGHVHWDVHVAGPSQTLPIPAVGPSSIWAPSREVASNFVSNSQGEAEKLLFYRGLGHFDTSLRVSDAADHLVIRNQSEQAVPEIFLLDVSGAQGAVAALGSVPAGGNVDVPHAVIDHLVQEPLAQYEAEASRQVAAALERSGLYADEALAMVHTWQQSYFATPGLRVLYVLPRTWTDRLLPLSISPAPKELVRTLVGRVEIMTRAEEQGLLASLKAAGNDDAALTALVASKGRFAESKLRRVLELARQAGESPQFLARVEGLIAQAEEN